MAHVHLNSMMYMREGALDLDRALRGRRQSSLLTFSVRLGQLGYTTLIISRLALGPYGGFPVVLQSLRPA